MYCAKTAKLIVYKILSLFRHFSFIRVRSSPTLGVKYKKGVIITISGRKSLYLGNGAR